MPKPSEFITVPAWTIVENDKLDLGNPNADLAAAVWRFGLPSNSLLLFGTYDLADQFIKSETVCFPNNNSPYEIASFRELLDLLIAAKDRGYTSVGVDRFKDTRGIWGFVGALDTAIADCKRLS